jgi:hypothetical protein
VQPLNCRLSLASCLAGVFNALAVISLMQSRTPVQGNVAKESHLSASAKCQRVWRTKSKTRWLDTGNGHLLRKNAVTGFIQRRSKWQDHRTGNIRLESSPESNLDFARPQECRVCRLIYVVVEDTLRIFNQHLSEGSIFAPLTTLFPDCRL